MKGTVKYKLSFTNNYPGAQTCILNINDLESEEFWNIW